KRNRYRRQWAVEKSAPDPAGGSELLASYEEIVRTVRQRIEHRHPRAAAKQVDFHEVGPAEQQCLPFAQVLLSTGRVRLFVRRRKHLDARDQVALWLQLVDVDETLGEFLLDERAQGDRLSFLDRDRWCWSPLAWTAFLAFARRRNM